MNCHLHCVYLFELLPVWPPNIFFAWPPLIISQFEDVNKGFEGIYYFEKGGKRFFMGLCESAWGGWG